MSRLCQYCASAARSVAASRLLVLRSRAIYDRRTAAALPARAGLRRTRADGAERRRLLRAAVARQRAGARPQRRRHRARLEHLPPPAGDHADRAAAMRRTSSARSTAGRTTCKGELLGAPHFADNPCLQPAPDADARTGTACCSTARATSQRDLARLDAERPRLLRTTCSTGSRCTSATTTGRPSSRSTSRTTTWCRSIRDSASSSLATTSTGSSRDWDVAADRSASTTAREGRHRRPTQRWHKAVLDYYRGETPPARRDLAHVLPEHHGRVVSARARRQHADPASVGRTTQRRRVLLSGGDRAVRARIRRGRAGGVPGDVARGRRDRRADGRRPQRAVRGRARSEVGPYQSPMEDGMQHFHEFLRRELDTHVTLP